MKGKWLTSICALALILNLVPSARAAENKGMATVLVGLAYGSSVLDGANLANDVGTGYRFGYLDGDRVFQPVAYTAETSISVVKTQNVWYGLNHSYSDSLKSYSDDITSDIGVGCWHVRLPAEAEPASFEEAQMLAQNTGGFPAWIDGVWQVRLGAYMTQEEAQTQAEAVGGTVVGTSAYGVSVVKTGTNTVLFQFDGGADRALTVAPGLDGGEKSVTHYRGARYYGMFQFRRINGGDLTVINAIDIDDYISCVLSQEMSSSWPMEALKAQAVCARNYVEMDSGRHKNSGFDVCPDVHCQAYPGMARANERTIQATAETAKLRAYYNGVLAETYFFSSDGGGTEACKNVWQKDLPYLCGVEDPYEASVADKISNYNWTVTYTVEELTQRLQTTYGIAVGTTVADIRVEEVTPTGNVRHVVVVGANGKEWDIYKENVRNHFGLRSMRYTVSKSGGAPEKTYYTDGGNTLSSMNNVYAIGGNGSVSKVSGTPYVITASGTQTLPGAAAGSTGALSFTFTGTGWGHHVGMSQWGAYAMAQQGFTFDQILKFYYPGIEIY